MKIFFALLTSIFLMYGNVYADGIKDIDGVKLSAKTAMEKIGKGELSEMFEGLKTIWLLPKAEIDAAKDQIISQRTMTDARFGKTIGVQQVSTDIVADTLIKIVYLEKKEKTAIRWQFIYYKANKDWILSNFMWDDKINDLFSK